ncbi:MAG: hypothetical protein JO227_04815 [Acetobacteraceae bacterium]|nr:hypothetical protein [Acetobacteraceae bacterium]
MSAHPPAVPPEQRSPKPGAGAASVPKDQVEPDAYRDQNRNTAEQGRQGNIKQNTTNQGHQQDRGHGEKP